jgi:hypothetical protein
MKKLFIILFIPLFVNAQTDSVKVSFSEEKVEKFEADKLEEELSYRSVKSALRVNMNWAAQPISFGDVLSLDYEQKVRSSFSIIGALKLNAKSASFQIEPRWYFDMNKRIREGLQKPNISGNYVSLSFHKNNLRDTEMLLSPIYSYRKSSFSLNIGKQFTNLLNFQLAFGYKNTRNSYFEKDKWLNNSKSENDNTWFIQLQNRVGFGFLFPREKNSRKGLRFLTPNEDINSLTKLSFSSFYFDKQSQNIELSAAYEHRLGNSYFSSNTIIDGRYSNYIGFQHIATKDTLLFSKDKTFPLRVYGNTPFRIKRTEFRFIQQIRYYPFKSKNIREGRSGRDFNGIYIGSQVSYFYTDGTKQSIDFDPKISHYNLGIVAGIQEKFKNKVFFDFGMAYQLKKLSDIRQTGLLVDTYIKLGFVK